MPPVERASMANPLVEEFWTRRVREPFDDVTDVAAVPDVFACPRMSAAPAAPQQRS